MRSYKGKVEKVLGCGAPEQQRIKKSNDRKIKDRKMEYGSIYLSLIFLSFRPPQASLRRISRQRASIFDRDK
jgi:hypothetical protein